MKRILVLALALILAVSSLVVPSYAAESDSSPSIVNLLQAVSYNFYKDGNRVTTSYSSAMNGWVDNGSSASWEFAHISSLRYSYHIVTINASSQPSSFVYEDTYGNTAQAELLGSYPAPEGNYYQYRIYWYNGTGKIRYTANWSSKYTGFFSVISAFGYADDTVSFTSLNYFANAMMYDNGDGEGTGPSSDDFRWPVSVGSGNNVSLPLIVDFDGPTGSDFYSLDYGEVFLKVPFDNSLKFFDSISFLIFTCGELDSVGSRLENSDGTVKKGLSTSVTYCGETQMVFSLEEQFERIHCYIVTVDLTGYDLSNSVLSLSCIIPSVFGSFIYQHDRGFYFQVSSIIGKFDVDDIPWYSYCAIWLNNQYDLIRSSISTGIESVISSVSEWGLHISNTVYNSGVSIVDTVSSWGRHISDTVYNSGVSIVNTVSSWGESLNNSIWNVGKMLADILNASGDNQGFQDEVDDQGDRLDQMDDALSSVTKPALDRVDTNISGIVSDTDLANTAHVYTYIIDDNIMAPALTMVTILAMMSFALFGKR